MASNLGTIFVELSLDDKVYKQRLSEVQSGAVATAKGVETAWKALGTKSEESFNAQRRAAENAYNLIKQSAGDNLSEITRAHEAMTNKINSLNEQQFGTSTSLIDKLKSNWIAASAAIYGAMKVIGEARELIDLGAKAIQVKSSFEIMTNAANVSGKAMLESMKAATKGTIDDSDMMQKSTKLMLAGYNPDQIVRFSGVVIAASQYMGTNVSESFERISDSLATRMPKAMVQSGAITKEQMKIVTEAIAGGATQAALMELAIANLAVKTLQLQGTQDEATLAIQRFKAQAQDTKEEVGKGLISVVMTAFGVFQAFGVAVYTGVAALNDFDAVSRRAAAWLAEKVGLTEKAIDLQRQANASEVASANAMKIANDLEKKSIDNLLQKTSAGATATEKEIKDGQKKVDAQVAGLDKFTAAAKKAANDAAKQQEKDLENQRKYLSLQTEAQKSTDAVLLAQLENSHRLFEISDTDYYQKKLALIGENRDKETSYLEKQDALSYASYQVKWDNAKSDQERSAANSELELKRMESAVKMQQIKDKAIIDGENLVTSEILKQRELRLSGMQFAYQEEEKLAAHLLDMFKGSVTQEGDADKDKFDRMEMSSTEYTAREIERMNRVKDASISAILATSEAFKAEKALELSQNPTPSDKQLQDYSQALIANASTTAQQIDKIKQDAAGKEANLERGLAKTREELWANSAAGVKGSEVDLYNYKNTLAEKERNRIIQDTGDEALANQVYANRVRDNYIEMAQSSNDWVVGVKAGLLDLQKGQTTWGQAAEDLTKKTFGHMETAAGDLFFDVITGNLDDLGKVFENLWKSILKDFLDMIAKMIVEWAALQALMAVAPDYAATLKGSGTGSSVGSTASGVGGSIAQTAATAAIKYAYNYYFGSGATAAVAPAATTAATEGGMGGLTLAESGYTAPAMAPIATTAVPATAAASEAGGAGGLTLAEAGYTGGSAATVGGSTDAAGGSSAAGSTMATVGAAAPYAVAALWAAYVMYRAFTDHRATPQETVKHDIESLNVERTAPGTQNWNQSGGSVGEMTPENLARIIDEMNYAGKQFGKTKADVLSWTTEALGPANVELVKTAEQMTLTKDALADLSGNFQAGAKPNADYQESVDLLKTTMATSTDPVKDLTAAITANSDYSITSAGAVQLLSDTMGLSADQTKYLTDAFADTAYTADHAGEQIDKLSTTLGIDKEAAKNLGQSLGLIPPVLDDATNSAYAFILQVQGTGMAFSSTSDAIAAMTSSMALNASQGDALKAIFADTDYVAAHIDETIAKLADTLDISKNSAEDLAKALGLIPKNVEVNIGVVTTGNMPASSAGAAAGGWIGHAPGGWITGGSGVKDDVFLGMTQNVMHWGMGGEFIVNKKSASRYPRLLQFINEGHASGGTVPGSGYPGGYYAPALPTDATLEQQQAQELANQAHQQEIDLLTAEGRSYDALTQQRKDELASMDASLQGRQQIINWYNDEAKHRDLEITLMEDQGMAEAALQAKRVIELRGMSVRDQYIQKQIYAQEDLNTANEKAAKIAEDSAALAKQRAGLEIDLMTAQGDATGALAATRQQELDALDPSLRSLKNQIYAAQDQKKATDDLAKAQTDAANALQTALGKLAPEQFSTSYEYRKAVGLTKIRGYDSGGYHPGGMRIVGESGPEIEWTGSSRIFNNSDSKGLVSNGEVVQAIRELRDDLVELGVQGLIINGKTAKAITKWDGIGLPGTQDNLTTFGN